MRSDAAYANEPDDGEDPQAAVEAADVLTAHEVARLLRVNIKTVYENAKGGIIPSVRLGRHFRFSRRAIMARLAECKSASRQQGH